MMQGNLRLFEQMGLEIEDVQTMAKSVGLEVDDLLLMDTHVSVTVKPPTPQGRLSEDYPPEVSTDEAADILNVSKDTVLKFKGRVCSIGETLHRRKVHGPYTAFHWSP